MSTVAVRGARPPGARAQGAVIALLLVLAAVAWVLTDDRMRGMDAGPGSDLGELGWFVVTWVLMTAAMMLPSVSPMVAAHRRRATAPGATAIFAGGYLLAWLGAGLVAYAVVEGLRSLDIAFLAWDEAGRYVAGGVILVGALYQLTVPKAACLRQCREPRAFLTEHAHPGALGALRTGVEHGSFCVACCWALMATLISVGLMSVGWMVFVAALIAAERLLPWKAVAVRGIALTLAVLALGVAFAPGDVPGLTVPGSGDSVPSMGSSKMG